MLAAGIDEFGEGADLLAAIGEKGDILVSLEALAGEYPDQPAFWLLVIAMNKSEVAGRRDPQAASARR